jgi:putative tricarboxylic transport membrane protein
MASRLFTEKKIGGSVAVLFGLLSLYEASKLYSYSRHLLTGDHALPGMIGLLLVLFGFSLYFERAEEDRKVQFPSGRTRVTLLLTILLIFLYCYLIPWLGYTVSTLAVAIGLVKMIGQYRWLFSILFGIIITAVLYVVFIVLLKTPVPSGIFNI